MDYNYSISGLMDVAVLLNTGTDSLFWSFLLIPLWLILMISFKNLGAGDSIDALNMSSFICLMVSFVLNAIGLVTILPIGIFLPLFIVGLLLKKFI